MLLACRGSRSYFRAFSSALQMPTLIRAVRGNGMTMLNERSDRRASFHARRELAAPGRESAPIVRASFHARRELGSARAPIVRASISEDVNRQRQRSGRRAFFHARREAAAHKESAATTWESRCAPACAKQRGGRPICHRGDQQWALNAVHARSRHWLSRRS